VTPPALAVTVTGVDAVTALVAIAKVALVAPCATDTPAGTVAAVTLTFNDSVQDIGTWGDCKRAKPSPCK
jgi:hypothetical protein